MKPCPTDKCRMSARCLDCMERDGLYKTWFDRLVQKQREFWTFDRRKVH